MHSHYKLVAESLAEKDKGNLYTEIALSSMVDTSHSLPLIKWQLTLK